jgi:DNA mismatch endonuclease (patch repair protein)
VADVFTKQKRSQVMAAIRSRGNKDTELKLAAILRAAGIAGWRRQQAVTGHPDFIFRRERLAVFVDGCFWHGCKWHCRMPKSRTEFWNPKIATNKKRDRNVNILLRNRGWRVLRIWEHSLRDPARAATMVHTALDSPSANV